jgi:hypothetical protein
MPNPKHKITLRKEKRRKKQIFSTKGLSEQMGRHAPSGTAVLFLLLSSSATVMLIDDDDDAKGTYPSFSNV